MLFIGRNVEVGGPRKLDGAVRGVEIGRIGQRRRPVEPHLRPVGQADRAAVAALRGHGVALRGALQQQAVVEPRAEEGRAHHRHGSRGTPYRSEPPRTGAPRGPLQADTRPQAAPVAVGRGVRCRHRLPFEPPRSELPAARSVGGDEAEQLALLLGSDLSRKIASGQTPHLFLIEFHLFHFRYIF